MSRLQVFTIVLVACVVRGFGNECKVSPKCTCTYGDDIVSVSEQTNSNEALAGAVGALGSMILSGGGFGLWYLIRGRKGSVGMDRTDSAIFEEDEAEAPPVTKRPPPYRGVQPAVNTPNVYTAGINDELTYRASQNRGSRTSDV